MTVSEMESTHEEGAGFELPPAKRQCTQSPRPTSPAGEQGKSSITKTASTHIETTSASANMPETTNSNTGAVAIPGLGVLEQKEMEVQTTEELEGNGILDMLMQHVESASNPTTSHKFAESTYSNQKPTTANVENEQSGVTPVHKNPSRQEDEGDKVHEADEAHTSGGARLEPGLETATEGTTVGNEPELAVADAEEDARSPETRSPNGQEVAPEGAEWEADSAPLESSSDSDTSELSSSDEDSDEEMDGEYAMLGLEEQARILMQDAGGSDDEGDRKGGDKSDRAQLRTANEKPEEVIPKPDITLTDEKIEELGVVVGVVESTVLVQAKVSGEYQVLESGSLLCLEDRTVVGVVAELFGRVEQPMYTIRFTNDAAIEEAGVSTPGTTIYYVEPPHSTFVFTQPLKSIKGSDASNFHDEEVGDDEMEFSDDEAEAEHKRRLKLKRQGRRDDRAGRTPYQNDARRYPVSHGHDGSANGGAYSNGALEMNYDDVDEGYTPLARPSNLHTMGQGEAPIEGRQNRPTTSTRGSDRGRGRGRGRARGYDRGRGRGSRPNSQNSNTQAQWNDQRIPGPALDPRYRSAPPSFATPPYQYQQNFPPPSGPPQMPAYPPVSPSPVSPLPATQFNFNAQQLNHNSHQYSLQSSPASQNGGGQHAQPHMSMAPPGSHINPAFLEALRLHQQRHPH